MKITYTFDSESLCETALITHAHAAEQRLRAAYPAAEIAVLYSPGAIYSVRCDDAKTELLVDALMRQTYRFTFDYQPLLQMMGALHSYSTPTPTTTKGA